MLQDTATAAPFDPAQSFETAPAGAPKLRVVSAHALMALNLPPRPMVLDPVLPAQGLAMLYSKRGVGKTFTALSLAAAVASGGKFLRWSAPQPRRVLYVDGEMPASAMKDRLAVILASARADGAALPDDNYLRVLSADLQATGMPDLTSEDGQQAIEATLSGAELVILDNLSTLCRAGKENEAESWLPVQHWALSLRRRGLSVLFVHHAGKGGGQRGTSRREDVLDTVIALRQPADYSATAGACFEVHLEKARGLAGAAAKPFEARLEIRDGRAEWSTRGLEDETLLRAAALYAEGMSVREVATELGIPASTAHYMKKRISDLADDLPPGP